MADFACSVGPRVAISALPSVFLQPHVRVRVQCRIGADGAQRLLAALSAFRVQRMAKPNRGVRGRKPDADGDISGRRERPVERRANIVDFTNRPGGIDGSRPWMRVTAGRREEIAKVLGMALRSASRPAAFLQLLERIGPDCFQQSPPTGSRRFVEHGQGFGDEVGDPVHDGRAIALAHDFRHGVDREPAGKDGQVMKKRLLRFRQQLMAPVECRAESLMTRQRRAAMAGQQPEPVRQGRRDLMHAERGSARRGELERQWNAIEMPQIAAIAE